MLVADVHVRNKRLRERLREKRGKRRRRIKKGYRPKRVTLDSQLPQIFSYQTSYQIAAQLKKGYRPKSVTPSNNWCGWQDSNPRPLGS